MSKQTDQSSGVVGGSSDESVDTTLDTPASSVIDEAMANRRNVEQRVAALEKRKAARRKKPGTTPSP